MLAQAALNAYLHSLQAELAHPEAREHAYRPALKTLLEALNPAFGAINDPAHIAAGAPDFIVLCRNVPAGFVEAKDVDADLSRVERDEQMKRYLGALSNLILTNYVEFRWYVGGEHRHTARLGEVHDRQFRRDAQGVEQVAQLLNGFAVEHTPTVASAHDLAMRMAGMTREIRRLIENSLPQSEALKAQMQAFGQTLIPNLDPGQFADLYAQTMAYGLFAARVRYEGEASSFTLHNAFWNLPDTNPFLQKLFKNIAQDLDPRVVWLVDSLTDLLAHTDTAAILRDFGHSTRQEDPVVHFYETFLSAYDPALRERRGVYYTPEPVVSYIVRSVDHLLKTRFERPAGLADEHTLILDPAVGTGTFLYFVIRHIHEALAALGQLGAWDQYVRQSLLPRLFGFELLMAPYAVAHMKLGIELQESGYTFQPGQRLGIYLTNTLEQEVHPGQTPLGFARFITEEANEAAAIKRDKEIMVVLGNPPYSGHSANKSEWITGLVRDYYFVDGQPLGERNPKWLQDDYVKFIRFGQWRIDRTGSGVLAFVTNHGYLDNPTFRGMRQQLMAAFDEIYILNLHGNSKKKETAPDGSPDQNVFDIQQGVAIGIFVKRPTPPPAPAPQAGRGAGQARVYHADLWGGREDKYPWLLAHGLDDTPWAELHPSAPFYLFVPQDVDLRAEYERGWKITEAMPINSLGITTARDDFTIHWTAQEVKETASDFVSLPVEVAREKYRLGKDARDWKVSLAQGDLRQHGLDDKYITPIVYRPFDYRFTYYTGQTRGFICMPRHAVMQHMIEGRNIGLVMARTVEIDRPYDQIFLTQDVVQLHSLSLKEVNSLFPLYLYPDPNELISDSPWPAGEGGRRPNLNPAFVRDLEARLGRTFVSEGRGDGQATFGPEDVFHYAYAVFHSPTYRARYAEFLKIDFPRLPLTSDPALFFALAAKGRDLVSLHLMTHPALDGQRITAFPVAGEGQVARGYPKYDHGRVYINPAQYFEGVPPDVWAFQVGGYQVLEKWLKDRRERVLSWDDLQHYQRIVVALQQTIRLMGEIDGLIPSWPLA